MELSLCRRRSRRSQALVGMAAVMLGWLGALVMVPFVLGLTTTVVSQPVGDYSMGTLVVTRSVPMSDLVRDDVLSREGGLVTVSSVAPGVLSVDGAERLLTSDTPTADRAVLVLPVAGLPLAGPAGLLRWLSAAAVAAFVAVSMASYRRSGRVRLAG